MEKSIEKFVSEWKDDPLAAKPAFLQYAQFLDTLPGGIEFVPRPGISYSVRGRSRKPDHDILALVDVVDDLPESRWLSVCFYASLVTDPEGRGDIVPKGLNNQDAICFDLDEPDQDQQAYILERLKEAEKNDSK